MRGASRGDNPASRALPGGRRARASIGVKSSAKLLAELELQDRHAVAEQRAQARSALTDGRQLTDRYPERLMPIAGAKIAWPDDDEAQTARVRYEKFCAVREAALAGYGFNTARAYWGDLEEIFWWAERRQFAPLSLDDGALRQYVALLRRRRYSLSTQRRRMVAYRRLQSLRTVVQPTDHRRTST